MQILNYINGNWQEPTTTNSYYTTNPHSKQTLGKIVESKVEDMRMAVEAAKNAAIKWSKIPSPKRGQYLLHTAQWLAEHIEDIAYDLTEEIGKPYVESKGEVNRAIQTLYYFASEGLQPIGTVLPSSQENTLIYTKREPLGPVGLITPWNFPIAIPVWKLAPALIYGNTVVLKPSEFAPKTAYYLMKAIDAANIPAGVVNCIFGTNVDLGRTLVDSEDIKGISFTGSTKVGKVVGAQAAANGKKVQLEMGGNNAIVVLKDADLEQAVKFCIADAYSAAGQKCTATGRLIVEEEVYDQVRDMIIEQTKKVQVGNPHKDNNVLGPVATKKQYQHVESMIQNGKKTLKVAIEKESSLLDGYYVSPIIFEAEDFSSEFLQHEIFGPVITLLKVNNLVEAIREVNRSKYGLSASIFTKDLFCMNQFIEEVKVGMVHINTGTVLSELHVPFGGMKESSYGSKEQGKEAIEFYTTSKIIYQKV